MRAAYTFETFRRHPDCEPAIYETHEPPWAALDPGIVEVVRLLWQAGFNPTDSGDGETKPEDERSMAGPHVVMLVRDPATIYAETNRLHELMSRLGTCIEPVGHTALDIEATYDPANGVAVIILRGVNNASIAREATP